MAEQIKGFTIELDLDSIKVDSGLKDMKSSMRQMNSEMRNNMSAFDRGEKSVEKYGVQLEGLNKKLELQTTVTESARKNYEKMVAEHGEGSRQAQEAAANYNHESATLNNLERHIGKVTTEMQAFKREQEIQSTSLWKTGDALQGFGDGLGKVSSKAREVGGSLTKWITMPALGVITAAGGITAAFGWDRLVGLDSAQAQLRGLGYEAEDVERITDGLVDDLDGGMMTMAEATSAAATAMAAGVEEGDELTRYIQTLDSAVVGGTGTFQEMEQVFGRITDQGKMTRNEFDMVSNRMPGFSSAVQEHMGVGSEAMYEMLRNGEITSTDFLDIMEGFAGGMAGEYAQSWQGMVENTKNYIGMIGESLLGGVFEQSKESIAEFIDILSSKEMESWAENAGEKIGEAFTSIVDKVKGAITWFTELDDSQQGLIMGLGAFVVAVGPLLLGLGTLGGIISRVSSGLGTFFKFLAPIMTPLKGIGKTAGDAGKSVGLLSRVFTFLTGPVGIAIGIISLLVSGFTIAYKRSETFRNFIHDLGEKLKEVFLGIVDWIRPGFDAVMSFFTSIKEKFTEFWATDGQLFIQAWQNIGSFLGTILSGIWSVVSWVFEQIKWIIADYVMPVIEFIIKQVWGNIKGIITGALDVIMGAVKAFSGLFTGDFSKMWEGVKEMFFGAIQVIWNWIQLQFIGRILKGVGGLVTSFGGFIKRMWTGAKGLFSDGIKVIWNWMKNSFVGRIISSIINFVKNFRSNITTLWTRVKDTFSSRINEVFSNVKNSFVGRIISSIIDFAKNFRTNIRNMWNAVKTNFTNKISELKTAISNSFVGSIIRSVTRLKDRFVNIAKDMWGGVKKQFSNIVDGAKKLPGRIGKGISNAKSKATNAMKSVGNSVIKWAGKPFNKVVDGVNWITGKLGIKTKIGTWDYPQYAKGTTPQGHPGGPAVIGEKGRELVKLPGGKSFVSPGTDTMMNLPKGTHVIPNKPTEQIMKSGMPHYAKGTGLWEKTKDFGNSVKDGAKKAWGAISDVWDYATNPSKLVNLVMDKISVIKDKAEIPTQMVEGGFDYLKTKPVEFVKNMFSKAEEEGANAPSGGGAQAWRPNIKRASSRMSANASSKEINGIIAQIHRESGGNEKIIQSPAVVDVNTRAGNPARGLLQYIPQTFNAYKTKGRGNIMSGYDQLLAFFNNSNWRGDLPYGRSGWGPTGGTRGFATGGLIKSKMMAMLGEEGEEMVIPLAKNRRTDAMKLLALTAKKLGADDGSYTRPSGMPSNDSNNTGSNELNEMIKLLMEQNEHLKSSNDLLTRLLGKDLDLYKLNKKVDEGLNNIGDRRRKAFGG